MDALERVRRGLRRRGIEPSDRDVSVTLERLKNPLYTFSPNPRGGQRAFVETIRDEGLGATNTYVALGGNRSGKTECGAFSIAWRARVTLDAIARQRKASGLTTPVWVVGLRYELVGNVSYKEKLARYLPASCVESVSWRNAAQRWPESIRLHNGIEVVFKSADQGRRAAQASSVFGVWIDEQIPDDVYSEIRMRCVDQGAPIFYTLTPIDPDPAMQRRYDAGDPAHRFFEFDIEDNRQSRGGHLPDAAVDIALASLREEDPELYETRKSGKFAGFRGAVFPTFSRANHVRPHAAILEALNVERERPRIHVGAAVDFGVANPHAFVVGFRTPGPRGTWYIVGEHYEAQRPIEYHGQRMRDLVDGLGIAVERLWCDPGDRAATAAGSEYIVSGRKGLARAGFPVVSARKPWSTSVALVKSLLARTPIVGADGSVEFGEPRLLISDACPNLIRELGAYRYAGNGQEGAIKADDHALDALRYLLFNEEAAKHPADSQSNSDANTARRMFPAPR